MASAILAGLLDAGLDPAGIIATAASQATRDAVARRFGVRTTGDNALAAAGARIVLLGVKPHLVLEVLRQAHVGAGSTVVSIAAGVRSDALREVVGEGPAIVRVMPNTPASVGRGVFIVSPAPGSQGAAAQVGELLSPVGTVVEVPERLHDAAMAVSGSGPAYVFLVAEAMIDAAVAMGIPRPQASQLVIGTLDGSAALLCRGEHPAVLRNQVTSPGGTTAAALDQLESHGVRTAFARALEACRDKAAGLG